MRETRLAGPCRPGGGSLKRLLPRVCALTLGFVLTLATAALAEITGITVDVGTTIPVGVTATYTATLDSNPPPVSGFAWYWAGSCGSPATWYSGGTQQSWSIAENLVGSFQVKCVASHAGVPKPPDTTKYINITVAPPTSDSIDNTGSWTTNINTPLPVTGYDTPTVGFLVNTSAGVAGANISGNFDRQIVPQPNGTANYVPVARQGNHIVVQFPFMDPNNAFATALDTQPFYQITSTNRIQYYDQCQRLISPPKSLTTRTVTWIKVDATHWKVTIQ